MKLSDFNLITDRTQQDVDYVTTLNNQGKKEWTADELAEFLADLKGSYNASDLNRVEGAMKYILERFQAIGYDAMYPTHKTDWVMTDYMNVANTERYLDNLRELRRQFTVPSDTPEVPDDMEQFTYSEANDIERILEIIDKYITKIEQAFFFSGELYGGEI